MYALLRHALLPDDEAAHVREVGHALGGHDLVVRAGDVAALRCLQRASREIKLDIDAVALRVGRQTHLTTAKHGGVSWLTSMFRLVLSGKLTPFSLSVSKCRSLKAPSPGKRSKISSQGTDDSAQSRPLFENKVLFFFTQPGPDVPPFPGFFA
eukprot:7848776-Pyramimonas_sp.AAC.1